MMYVILIYTGFNNFIYHPSLLSTEIPSVGITAFLCPPLPLTPAQDIYPVAALSFAFNHSFQYDHPLNGITALNLTELWYLLLPWHFTQLSAFQALCKIRYKIVIPSFIPQILQIFIKHIVVGERMGNKSRQLLFLHEAYSLPEVINITGIDSNK